MFFHVWDLRFGGLQAARKVEREKNGKKQKKVDIVFVTNLNTSGG